MALGKEGRMSSDIAVKRQERPARLWDLFDISEFGRWPELGRWFEGLRPLFREEDRLRIEQELTDDTIVIRAEMPGIDPEKNVEITVVDGVLHIRAERSFEQKEEKEGQTRSEFHYGSFSRSVRVPNEVDVDDVKATYTDGILEVRFPYKVPTEAEPRKVTVTRS
jgi:HSP20 family protein